VTEESSRPKRKGENPATEPLNRPGIVHKFDLIAAPRRWAVQGRMRTVRLVLIVLAVVTIAIVAYAQYLTWRPDTSAEATLAALNQLAFEQAFATATPLPTVPTATQAPPPTVTPTPKPTNTLVPVPTGRPRTRATLVVPVASPVPLAAPELIAPGDGVTTLDRMVFEWAWGGPSLEENQAFDLRIWSAQEQQSGGPRRGVVPPTKQTSVEVSLAAVPAIIDYGPGDYFWTVVVVELQDDGSPRVAGAGREPEVRLSLGRFCPENLSLLPLRPNHAIILLALASDARHLSFACANLRTWPRLRARLVAGQQPTKPSSARSCRREQPGT
jgi:hypothetical protein